MDFKRTAYAFNWTLYAFSHTDGDDCSISLHRQSWLSSNYEEICRISSHKIASKVCIFE